MKNEKWKTNLKGVEKKKILNMKVSTEKSLGG